MFFSRTLIGDVNCIYKKKRLSLFWLVLMNCSHGKKERMK